MTLTNLSSINLVSIFRCFVACAPPTLSPSYRMDIYSYTWMYRYISLYLHVGVLIYIYLYIHIYSVYLSIYINIYNIYIHKYIYYMLCIMICIYIYMIYIIYIYILYTFIYIHIYMYLQIVEMERYSILGWTGPCTRWWIDGPCLDVRVPVLRDSLMEWMLHTLMHRWYMSTDRVVLSGSYICSLIWTVLSGS